MSTAPLYSKTSPDTSRGLMAAVWHDMLPAYASNDPSFGIRFTDDFNDTNNTITGTGTAETVRSGVNSWTVDRDGDDADGTVSFVNAASVLDGVAILASNTTNGDDGVTAHCPAARFALPTHATLARGPVVFQARVDDLDVAEVWFVGLSVAGNQFIDGDSLLPDKAAYIGFYSDDHGATVKFVTATSTAGVNDSLTISDDDLNLTTFNNLAWRVNADGSVEIGVNGKWYQSARQIDKSALPVETLVPRLCALTGDGSDAPDITVDRIDIFMASSS